MDLDPWVRSGGPWVNRPRPEPLAGSPGPGACPWAFFGYFLSQQKVTPRRGGETRQMAFRTERDRTAKGQTGAWQSKKTALQKPKQQNPEKRVRPQDTAHKAVSFYNKMKPTKSSFFYPSSCTKIPHVIYLIIRKPICKEA